MPSQGCDVLVFVEPPMVVVTTLVISRRFSTAPTVRTFLAVPGELTRGKTVEPGGVSGGKHQRQGLRTGQPRHRVASRLIPKHRRHGVAEVTRIGPTVVRDEGVGQRGVLLQLRVSDQRRKNRINGLRKNGGGRRHAPEVRIADRATHFLSGRTIVARAGNDASHMRAVAAQVHQRVRRAKHHRQIRMRADAEIVHIHQHAATGQRLILVGRDGVGRNPHPRTSEIVRRLALETPLNGLHPGQLRDGHEAVSRCLHGQLHTEGRSLARAYGDSHPAQRRLHDFQFAGKEQQIQRTHPRHRLLVDGQGEKFRFQFVERLPRQHRLRARKLAQSLRNGRRCADKPGVVRQIADDLRSRSG